MKKLLIYCILLLVISACEKAGRLPEISFDSVSKIDMNNEIPLDSLVKRTEIVRFTSESNLMIGKIRRVLESRNDYFIVTEDFIFRFDKTGKLLNTVGKKGKGPGEYIAPWEIDADEVNQYLYVMDYFGRKMLCYSFEGKLDTEFDLPVDKFAINSFRLYNGQILYLSNANSVIPEIYFYNQTKGELTEVSVCEREMLAGEALMGSTYVTGDIEKPFLFHYFNDTVYNLVGTKLEPNHLLLFGKLKIKFDDLIVNKDKSTGEPHVQVYKMFRSEMFTLVQYGVSGIQGKKYQTYLTGIYRNDFSGFSPSINLVSKENPLLSIPTGTGFGAGLGGSLLRTLSAYEVLKLDPDFDISENDNPILIKYHMR